MWTLPPGAVRQELDVRGMALDEAIPEVEKFIDDAMLSHSERSASFMEMEQGFCAPAFRIVCVGIRA